MIKVYITMASGNESEAAHRLLNEVLSREYGIYKPELVLGPWGKPAVTNGPAFSISHSKGYAALAVGEKPVGLDLELVRPYMEKLPERIFSPGELDWFRSRYSTKVDFFTLWTLKESYLKYLGTGLTGFPNHTDFYQDRGKQWHLRGENLSFQVFEEKKLLLTVCSQEKEEIRILWQ